MLFRSLVAATALFAEVGYEAATIRATYGSVLAPRISQRPGNSTPSW